MDKKATCYRNDIERSPVETFLRMVKLWDTSHRKVRMGNDGDGGYVIIPNLVDKGASLYSFGIGDDSGFEEAFIEEFNPTLIHLFDPTIDVPPTSNDRFCFHRQGIGQDCVSLNEFEFLPNSILKIDVEWNEWSALIDVNEDVLKNFTQILIELHVFWVSETWSIPQIEAGAGRFYFTKYFKSLYNTTFLRQVNDQLFLLYGNVLHKLNKDFVCYHIHANNSLPMFEIDGFHIPPLLELSFVNKKLVGWTGTFSKDLPIEDLDIRNKTDRPDITNYYPFRRHTDAE